MFISARNSFAFDNAAACLIVMTPPYLFLSLDVLPRVTCPNHPDSILVEDYRAGDMICSECGLVVGK